MKKVERRARDAAEAAGRARKALWAAAGHKGSTKDYLIWLSAMWAMYADTSMSGFTEFLVLHLANGDPT